MASIPEVWQALRGQLVALLAPSIVPADHIYIDNPPPTALDKVAKTGEKVVAIFDLKYSRNTTRWPRLNLSPTVTEAGVTTEVSDDFLPVGGSQTITLGGLPKVGDCVSAIFQNQKLALSAYSANLVAMTADDMATQLASEINATDTLKGWVNAVAVGAVVTVTNIGAFSLQIASMAGNGGQRVTEVARIMRPCQITLWTKTYQERDAISPLIFSKLGLLQMNFGFAQADGTWTRLLLNQDMAGRDDKRPDIYRYNWIVDLECGITTVDAVAQILGFSLIKTLSYEPILPDDA